MLRAEKHFFALRKGRQVQSTIMAIEILMALIILVFCLTNKWMENNRHDYNQQEVVKALLDARQAILEVRNLLREIGETAGVPIEPEPQTQLLDVTMNMEGVLLAGVPGAGGFDVIFAITLGNSARARVAHEWSSNGVLPLLVTEDPKGVALENSDPRDREIASGIHSIKLD